MSEILQAIMVQLKGFQIFLWLSTVTGLLGFLAVWVCFKRLRTTSRRFRFLAVFLDVTTSSAVAMASVWLKQMLVFSVILFFRRMPLSHYFVLAICTLLLLICFLDVSRGIVIFCFNALLAMGLFVDGMLRSYVVEVNPDLGYMLVLIVMNLCIGAYSLYVSLTELQMILEEKRLTDEERKIAQLKEEE